MKDVLFLLWLRMCYLFCNKPPFFCFHLILFHWGFSLFLSFIDFSSPSPYIHSHIFLFSFPINECLLVTEHLKLNMITRPRRQILDSCRESHPGVAADRQRPVCFHTQMFYHDSLNHIQIMPGWTLPWDNFWPPSFKLHSWSTSSVRKG